MRAFAASAVAVGLTAPLGVLVYRLAFLRRLGPEERDFLRARWSSESSRALTVSATGLAFAFLTSGVVAEIPFWALFVVWLVTWPWGALSYSHWSLGLLRSDPTTWRAVVEARQIPPFGGVFLHLIAALLPAALFLTAIQSNG